MKPARPLAAVVLAAALAAPSAARGAEAARPVSAWDGSTLGEGEAAAYAALGWPTLTAGFLVGAADALDLGIAGDWQLHRGWLEADLTARLLLWSRGNVSFAARARAGLFHDTGRDAHVAPNVEDTGLVVGAGVAAGFRLGEELLTAGFDVPIAIGFEEGSTHLPLLLSAGLDHPVAGVGGTPATVGFGLQAGPWAVGGRGDSFFYWAVVLRGTHGL